MSGELAMLAESSGSVSYRVRNVLQKTGHKQSKFSKELDAVHQHCQCITLKPSEFVNTSTKPEHFGFFSHQ